MKTIYKTLISASLLLLLSSNEAFCQTPWYTFSCRFANVSDHHTHIRVSRIGLPGAAADDLEGKTPFINVFNLSPDILAQAECMEDKDAETAEYHGSGHDFIRNNIFIITATHRNKRMKIAFAVEANSIISKINLGVIEFIPGDYWITPILETDGEVTAPIKPLNPLPEIKIVDFQSLNKLAKICN